MNKAASLLPVISRSPNYLFADLLIFLQAKYGRKACWPYPGALLPNGYSTVFVRGGIGKDKKMAGHRLAYIMRIGDIPKGLVLDHLCKNPACVNPWHLEPVTQRENVRRSNSLSGIKSRQTHCIRGHALSGNNLMLIPHKDYFLRRCRTCSNVAQNRRRGVKALAEAQGYGG